MSSGDKHLKREKPLGPIVIARELLTSKPWLELPKYSPIAHQVYLLFLSKRRMEKPKRKGGKWVCTNNGELVFTYSEAGRLGITAPRFTRCIDTLLKYGFLDVAKPGNAATREETWYKVSERWRDYGEPAFIEHKRTPAKRGGSKDPGKHLPRPQNPETIRDKDKVARKALGGNPPTKSKSQASPQLIEPPRITEAGGRRKPAKFKQAVSKPRKSCGDCKRIHSVDCQLHGEFKVDSASVACCNFQEKCSRQSQHT